MRTRVETSHHRQLVKACGFVQSYATPKRQLVLCTPGRGGQRYESSVGGGGWSVAVAEAADAAADAHAGFRVATIKKIDKPKKPKEEFAPPACFLESSHSLFQFFWLSLYANFPE